ncbi:uncharacterized protein LOC126804760 [Argentina anserina]|uniref:uncharacterized protein LOC126804760 n=1 Tax=Argentina anserina TaxID=57926 RepID=UPI0021761FB7|nr:uncharacterized protein LOC126804760 [Potentilla anserina]
MANASDSETEDIVIEFEGNFDLDSLADKQLQLLGIDTDEPVLKVDSKFYKIDVKDSIGSRLLLEQDSDEKQKYYGKTDKVVTARRVIVKPK